MSAFLHQRIPLQLTDPHSLSPRSSSSTSSSNRSSITSLTRVTVLIVVSLLIITGVLLPLVGISNGVFDFTVKQHSKWRDYSLEQAVKFVANDGTVIVCAVSLPYLPFLNNWLISVSRQKHDDKVLVIAEDYVTLEKVNEKWPGHAVLVPPAPDSQMAHKFGSQGFFNFTSRRPRHLLSVLELGYNVMYNDVDMVWLSDPFPYMVGNHDVYFTDDMTPIKPLNHSHDLPPPGKKGRPYICSCMIFMRPTAGAKLVLNKWIEEMQEQPWSREKKANDQPAFNFALMKTAEQVDLYLLPQVAFPTGGLYFRNKTWVKETKGKHVIIHNNYILGFEKKIKRFKDYGLWLVDDHAEESPLGRI